MGEARLRTAQSQQTAPGSLGRLPLRKQVDQAKVRTDEPSLQLLAPSYAYLCGYWSTLSNRKGKEVRLSGRSSPPRSVANVPMFTYDSAHRHGVGRCGAHI